MIRPLSLRPASPEDAALLFALFAESRVAELALPGLAPELLRQLLDVQYRGRAMTYSARYPAAQQWIVSLEDGTSVGQILLDRQPEHWRIVDLAIQAAWQRRGIGTSVVAAVQRQCATRRIPLRLAVAPGHPAEQIYHRLGFEQLRIASEQIDSFGGTVLEMEWRSTPDTEPASVSETALMEISG